MIAQAIGRKEEYISIPPQTVSVLFVFLMQEYGNAFKRIFEGGAEGESRCLILLNENILPREALSIYLNEGDEVKIIPPVAGG